MSEQPSKKGFFSRLFTGEAPAEPAKPAPPPPTTPEPTVAHPPVPVPPASADDRLAESDAAPAETGTQPAQPQPVAEDSATLTTSSVDSAPDPGPDSSTSTGLDLSEKKASWFNRLKSGLNRTSSKLTEGISGLFTKRKLDADTLDDLEDLLIQADLGVETSMRITQALSQGRYQKGISADDVRQVLAEEVTRVLHPVARPLEISSDHKPHVVLMVGVNGTGKTTTIGKLAQRYAREGKKVMMAAGDTFRAAAIDQLKVWGERSGTRVISREVGADASGLAFDALKEAQSGAYDLLLVDTAGRLQNKQALMDELEKVIRVLKKLDPTAPHNVLLVLDATTGQNALGQVEVFRQRAGVTGLILTKLDGTARGGIIVAIAEKFGLPVHAIGVGEGIDDLQPFAAETFAKAIADVA